MACAVGAQAGAGALWLFTLTTAAAAQMSLHGTTTVVASVLAGVAFGGVATGALLRAIPAYTLLRHAEIVRLLVVVFAIFAVDQLTIAVLVALCATASLCESVMSACRWQLIQWRFPNVGARDDVSRQLQTLEAFLAVALPVIGGIATVVFGWRASLAVCGLGSLIAILSIAMLGPDGRDGNSVNQGVLAGFSAIGSNQSIRLLLAVRVLTGSSLLIWAIYVPVALKELFRERFPLYQGLMSGLTAAAIAFGGLILIRLARFHDIGTLPASRHLAAVALVVYGAALVIALLLWPSAWIYALAAMAVGLYSVAIRTSIVITAQRITPPNLVAQVVSAGDSLVRSANLLLALAFSSVVTLMTSDASRASLFVTIVAASVCAILLMARLGRHHS